MNENVDINLLDLGKKILSKWKLMIGLMMFFALLIGGISALNSKKEIDTNASKMKDESINQVESQYEKNLTQKEIEEVKIGVELYFGILENFQEVLKYNNESMLMQIEPSAVPTVKLYYNIDTHYEIQYPIVEATNYNVEIVNTYVNDVNSIDMTVCEELASELKLSGASYVQELIQAEEIGVGGFVVEIKADNENNCDIIADRIVEYVSGRKDKYNLIYGEYDITLVSRNFFEEVDEKLFEKQQSQYDIINYHKNLTNYIDSTLSKEQEKYFKELISQTVSPDQYTGQESGDKKGDVATSTTSVSTIKYINIKHIILGGILGLCLGCCIILVKYIFSGTVKTKEDFKNIYDLSVLGSIAMDDRMIKNKEDNCIYNELLMMICATINVIIRKQGVEKIYITGSCVDEKTKLVKKHLYEGLKKKGLEVKNGSSIIYDASALEEMSNNDAVVLVERVDRSLHEDMKKEIELCCKLEKNIIGTVCVK